MSTLDAPSHAAPAPRAPGFWQLDLTTHKLYSSDSCKVHFGLPAGAELSYATLFAMIHADDRVRVRQSVARAVADGTSCDVEYRNVWPDGSVHWIRATSQVVGAPGGTPGWMVGTMVEITPPGVPRPSARAAAQALRRARPAPAVPLSDDSLVRLARVAREVAQESLPRFSGPRAKQTYAQPQLLAIVCVLTHAGWTYREATDHLHAQPLLREALQLSHVPHYTTVQKFFARLPAATLQTALSQVAARMHR